MLRWGVPQAAAVQWSHGGFRPVGARRERPSDFSGAGREPPRYTAAGPPSTRPDPAHREAARSRGAQWPSSDVQCSASARGPLAARPAPPGPLARQRRAPGPHRSRGLRGPRAARSPVAS
jgi:hypothetical protein